MSIEPNDSPSPQPPPEAADAAYPSLQELADLLPRYEMHGIIGIGGMGAVYKARQIALDRWVAIKVLPIAASESAEDTQRFIKEARSMARLVHPHIVAVFDFGQTLARHLFLVMEYVEGQDLHLRTRAGEITPQKAREVIAQLCDALQFAHDRGVAHRDIKPANILITNDWKVKIADFGLARDLSAQPNADEPEFGTPDYTAPERLIIGAVVDHRADIYALGVVIHEMLTGKTPAAAGKNTCKNLPDGFAGVISKCLMSEPDLRYQKASEVKVALLTATAERQKSDSEQSKKTGPTPQNAEPQTHIEPLSSYTSYRPSRLARLSRVLGPIGWGMASVLLVGAFAWLLLKDKVSFEVAKEESPDKQSAEVAAPAEPVKSPEPSPAPPAPAVSAAPKPVPAPAVKPPAMVTAKVPQDMAEPVIQLPETPPYTVPDGPPGEVARFDGHTGPVYSLGLLGDQHRILSASMDGTLRVWDVASQKTLIKVDVGIDQLLRVQPSVDETMALVYSSRTDKLAMVDLTQGKVLHTAQFPNERLTQASLAADGKTVLAGGSGDDPAQNLFVWKPGEDGPLEPVSGYKGRVYAITPTPSGRELIVAGAELIDATSKSSRPQAAMFSPVTGQFTALDSSSIGYITRFFTTPGTALAYTTGSTPKVLSLPSFQVVRSFQAPPREGPFPLAGRVVDRDRLLLTSWTDFTLRAHEISSGEEVWRTSLSEPVTDIAVSRDEHWAVLSTRYKDTNQQQEGTFDLILWRLPKWSALISHAATEALAATQLADLGRHDPELEAMRQKLKTSFVLPDGQEIATQRQTLDTLYVRALRLKMPGLAPTEQNAIKKEVDIIALGDSLPPADMDFSLPKPLLELRSIYRQQLEALLEKQKSSVADIVKSVESYLTPLRQKREAEGDAIGAARVAAVLKEWQQSVGVSAKADPGSNPTPAGTPASPPAGAPTGTPTKRPDRAGSVFSIQRSALNTNPTMPPPEVSRVPRTLGPVVAIAGGSDHLFALLPDGSLRAWGQWGGTTVGAPSAATDVVQIDSSDLAALALRSDGKIIAWGPNTVGSATTWQMKEGKVPLSVHAGVNSSGFVLCTDGSIQDVGSGETAPPSGIGPVARLVFIPSGNGWCAIQRDGTPVYWGAMPLTATALPPGMRDLIGISIAQGYGVALQRDGTMIGWGQPAQDQRFRVRKFTGAIDVLHDYAGRVFAVHRSDHSWEFAPNPNIPEYVAENHSSLVEGRLRGCIDAVFTREYVIGLKP